MNKFLQVEGYKSCQVIFHKSKLGLALCNRAECPLYKKIRCKTCEYKVLFHDSDDRKLLKMILSMAHCLENNYTRISNPIKIKRMANKIIAKIQRNNSIDKRIDIGTRTLIYKILHNLSKKYYETDANVDTFHGTVEFAVALQELAQTFLPVDFGDLGYKPEICE